MSLHHGLSEQSGEMDMSLVLEAGKKYRTRGGCVVEVLRTGIANPCSVVCVWTDSNGYQAADSWYSDGRYVGTREHGLDIVAEIKPKITKYMNFYKNGSVDWRYSRKEADAIAHDKFRLACVRVEFEEGQFDE